MSIKLERITKFNFTGADFMGRYEEEDSIGEQLSISLGLNGSITLNPATHQFDHQPNATFYALTCEEDIDRIAAAAKIAWRSTRDLAIRSETELLSKLFKTPAQILNEIEETYGKARRSEK